MIEKIVLTDLFLRDLFFLNPMSVFLAKLFLFLSWIGEWGIVWIFILVYLLWRSDELVGKQLFLRTFMFGLLSVLIVSTWAKFAIGRFRPFTDALQIWHGAVESLGLSLNYPVEFAMPSFHAMSSFLAYTLISSHVKKGTNWYLVLAILISYSRLYLGVHYFSDVVVGALGGVIIGKIILKSEKFLESKAFLIKN